MNLSTHVRSLRSVCAPLAAVGMCLLFFACSGSSSNSSSPSSNSGSDDGSGDPGDTTTDDGGTRAGADGGSSKSSDGGVGNSSLPSAAQWHAGGLTTGDAYSSLVGGTDKVFALRGLQTSSLTAVAYDSTGKNIFATDVSTPLATMIATPVRAATAAVETDETLVVTVLEDAQGHGLLVKLAADGSIAWHAQPTLLAPGIDPYPATLSRPAIAADGTIYVTISDPAAGSGDPSPQLWSYSPTGVKRFALDLAPETGDVPPTAGAPWITPSGSIAVLVTGTQQTVVLVTPGTTPAIASAVDLEGTLVVNGNLTPLADGTWLANVSDFSRTLSACEGDGIEQPEIAHYGADGSLLWHVDIAANERSSQPVTGAGGDLLVAWGNCSDGTGAGLYTISESGVIAQTYGKTLGDGLSVIGGSTDAYLLVQNDIVSGVETGPVVEAVNRTTGVADAMIGLPCAAPGAANDEYSEMTMLGDTMIVACQETPERPGNGGIYALKMSPSLASGTTWPYADGNPSATRNQAP